MVTWRIPRTPRGCGVRAGGTGTAHNGLSLSDGYNIALIICNEEWRTDPCSGGSKSARNPLA